MKQIPAAIRSDQKSCRAGSEPNLSRRLLRKALKASDSAAPRPVQASRRARTHSTAVPNDLLPELSDTRRAATCLMPSRAATRRSGRANRRLRNASHHLPVVALDRRGSLDQSVPEARSRFRVFPRHRRHLLREALGEGLPDGLEILRAFKGAPERGPEACAGVAADRLLEHPLGDHLMEVRQGRVPRALRRELLALAAAEVHPPDQLLRGPQLRFAWLVLPVAEAGEGKLRESSMNGRTLKYMQSAWWRPPRHGVSAPIATVDVLLRQVALAMATCPDLAIALATAEIPRAARSFPGSGRTTLVSFRTRRGGALRDGGGGWKGGMGGRSGKAGNGPPPTQGKKWSPQAFGEPPFLLSIPSSGGEALGTAVCFFIP
eukprot:CAMPEP_0177626202 /NCGR_PEP_ID=MMETSP0419_2-20121207/30525_1 /TAXON_ID=582737 /ORGANISM="Tetraselmis sp., Strain GSL018" /LENGTH=375 /DNA_ID=CAMNT_0019127235 /DNA_START=185 /DNA_END=1310 /DNA_ORIENTATION=+